MFNVSHGTAVKVIAEFESGLTSYVSSNIYSGSGPAEKIYTRSELNSQSLVIGNYVYPIGTHKSMASFNYCVIPVSGYGMVTINGWLHKFI